MSLLDLSTHSIKISTAARKRLGTPDDAFLAARHQKKQPKPPKTKERITLSQLMYEKSIMLLCGVSWLLKCTKWCLMYSAPDIASCSVAIIQFPRMLSNCPIHPFQAAHIYPHLQKIEPIYHKENNINIALCQSTQANFIAMCCFYCALNLSE